MVFENLHHQGTMERQTHPGLKCIMHDHHFATMNLGHAQRSSTCRQEKSAALKSIIQSHTRAIALVTMIAYIAYMQENLGALGWELSSEDFQAISNITEQMRYFEGAGMGYQADGPWHTYEELWNESIPEHQP